MNNELNRKNIDIAVITETKKKLKGTKELKDFVMIYSGVPQNKRACCGVAILVNNKWKNKIISYSFINERIVTCKFKIDRGHFTVIGVYAPEEGRKEETKIFYDELQKELTKINTSEYVVITGDLNARIGNQPIPGIVGTYGEQLVNNNGEELRQFATYNKMKITNTFF